MLLAVLFTITRKLYASSFLLAIYKECQEENIHLERKITLQNQNHQKDEIIYNNIFSYLWDSACV